MSESTTQILNALSGGDESALEDLLPLVYDELKSIASGYMGRESPHHTLSATALVNEAYLRMVDQTRVHWQGRTHFCAVAAQMMRRILVDHARRKQAQKRKKTVVMVSVDDMASPDGQPRDIDLVALDELLDQLSQLNQRHARIVELRFFAGLTVEETSRAVGISTSTVKDDWRVARAWLLKRLESG